MAHQFLVVQRRQPLWLQKAGLTPHKKANQHELGHILMKTGDGSKV